MPWVLSLALLAAGCHKTPPAEEVPLYEPALTAADFPGVAYPIHAGPIPRPAGPVWVVGIDGATWQLIEPWATAGELPTLAELMRTGAWGELTSEAPTISPALWATVATGMPRFVHGVDNFLVKLPGSAETDEAGPLDRRAPALWELVGAAGGMSAVVSWFGSHPAEAIPGHYVSAGFDPEKLQTTQVHPAAFLPKLAQSRIRLRPSDFEAIGVHESYRKALLADARTLAAVETIAAESQPDLLVAYFSGIDIVQHTAWRHMDPSSQAFPEDGPADPRLAGVIPAYYRYIDYTLARLRELMPPDGTLVLLSDHGAGPMRVEEAHHFQLEVLLEMLGLIDGADGPVLAIGELYRHDKRIWLNLEGVESGGTVPLDEAQEEAAAVADRLAALRADDGAPMFASIVDRTVESDWLPGEPALVVRFSRSALFTKEFRDDGRTHDFSPVRLRHQDVSGSHRADGLLLIAGSGVRPGRFAEAASLYNVAPTVLWLLGLPQDARMLRHAPTGGGVLERAFGPDALLERPRVMVGQYPDTDRSHMARGTSPGLEIDPARESSLEKLRSLGYIR